VAVVVGLVGFGIGISASGGAGRLFADDVDTAAAVTATLPQVTTTATTAAPTTTTSQAPTTSATEAPTTTTVTQPAPPPTSVVSSPTGTPAQIVVYYAGQSGGVLRIPPGLTSQVVLANVGGSVGEFSVQTSSYLTVIGSVNGRLNSSLSPGYSVGLTVEASSSVPAGSGGALTFTLPNGSIVVVPVQVQL